MGKKVQKAFQVMTGVRYHVSGIRYQVSGVRCQVSGIRCQVVEKQEVLYWICK